MNLSRSITRKLHRALLPYEDDIYKLEDLAFFLDLKTSFFFFTSFNLTFLFLHFSNLSFYSIIFIISGLYFTSEYINFRKLFSFFLEEKISDIEPEKGFKRFNIAQISALVGTSIYAIIILCRKSFNAIIDCNLKIMILILVILLSLFYCFNSISDFLLFYFIINFLFFLPLLLQKKIIKFIDLIQEQFYNKLFTEENNTKINNKYKESDINNIYKESKTNNNEKEKKINNNEQESKAVSNGNENDICNNEENKGNSS